MAGQSYLIDTNIMIGLEDHHTVNESYSRFHSLAAAHKIDIYVHEVARDDIERDQDTKRREISLSKVKKYQTLKKTNGVTEACLSDEFGILKKPNDVVDATLLHALRIGAVDFLVTQDKGLHERAQKHSTGLARRVLFLADAIDLITQTYEPTQVPIRYVNEVSAHTINRNDDFFNTLKDDYPEFDAWWRDKCVRQHRLCWIVYDNNRIAGLIVRKDENSTNTDAITKSNKILKICTFKVSPAKRGVKLGELLLKQVLWYAQANAYDLAYLTTYENQQSLMNLLEFYGFYHADTKTNGELVYERSFSSVALTEDNSLSVFEMARKNYPRFLFTNEVHGFGVPIKESYHDILYPDLRKQGDLLIDAHGGDIPTQQGNTIRKVYLCRAQSNLGEPGSILFFYKGKSNAPPSQAMTAIGILESVTSASSMQKLMQLTGGRSVYSERQLKDWNATLDKPVKVINYLLVAYIEPPIFLNRLSEMGIITGSPPQSIYRLNQNKLAELLEQANLGFNI